MNRGSRLQALGATAIVLILMSGSALFANATQLSAGMGVEGPSSPLEQGSTTSSSGARTTSSSPSGSRTETSHTGSSTTEHGSPSRTESSRSVSASSATIRSGSETSQTKLENETQEEHELKFRMVATTVQGSPKNYLIGQGEVNIEIEGTALKIHVEFERMNPSTQYALLLSVNGTSHSVGNMTTSREGVGDVRAVLTLAPGRHSLGLTLLDTSTFKKGTVVMLSDPRTLTAMIVQSTATTSESESEREQARKLTTVQGGKDEDDKIKAALQHRTIPAVVHVNGSGASASVLDSNFSVSVGRLRNNGLLVSITATNVTGPRVLLINLTKSSILNFSSGNLLVNLDGHSIQQASSVLQVLNAQSSDPPRFVVVATSSGLQLLVSIPHFSLHTIEILPVVAAAVSSFLSVEAPLLAISVLAVTSVFAVVYARRRRALR